MEMDRDDTVNDTGSCTTSAEHKSLSRRIIQTFAQAKLRFFLIVMVSEQMLSFVRRLPRAVHILQSEYI